MYESNKIKEAEHFLSQMQAMQQDQDMNKFIHNLSAFLTAARSVLQYALGHAKKGSNRRKWYDNKMRRSTVFAFFKGKRDANIHEQPVSPKQNIGQIWSNLGNQIWGHHTYFTKSEDSHEWRG